MLVARAFQAFFNAPAGAVGPAVVVELFFAKERGQKLVSHQPSCNKHLLT